MKKWLLIGGVVVVLAVIVVANLKKSGTPTVEAQTSKVERTDVTSSISAPGKVRAVSSVDISAEVPGRVVELAVVEGDSVSQGDLLIRLDDAQYRSRVEQAQAAVASVRATLDLAKARLERLEQDLRRQEALLTQGLTSTEVVEHARTDLKVQKAQVEASGQDVGQAGAALKDARDNLEKTVYRAPVSGVISRLNIEKGEIVITGTMNNPGTVIMSVADLSAMEVEAEVDEADVVNVIPGQKAKITVDAIPDTTFAGTVASVGNSGRQAGAGADQVVNFEVKVRFDQADTRLKPGMTADVDVQTRTAEKVLTVPIQALVARNRGRLERDRRIAASGGKKLEAKVGPDSLSTEAREKWEKEIVEGIYKVKDGKVVFLTVTTGIADETRIQITADVAEGDKVVSGPFKVLRELKEGTAIKEKKKTDKGEEKN